MSDFFSPDVWKETPAIMGRVATEADLTARVAVFHQQGRGVAYAGRDLPALAIARLEGQPEQKVVVVQMEKTPSGDILCGARGPGGGELVCMLDELTFLEAFP